MIRFWKKERSENPINSNLTKSDPSYAELSDMPDPTLIPYLDRPDVSTNDLTERQKTWRETGVSVLSGFLPDDLMDAYVERREKLKQPGGWASPTPYEHVHELRDLALYPPLMEHMKHLIGEDMLLHLALTGWVSTDRNWHQDDYLNPSFVNSWYAAVWMALDDIHPDAGPFEYIPGSHKWPLLRGEKVREYMSEDELREWDEWPKRSEKFVVSAVENEIERRAQPSEKFLAKRGDVLIWHGRLMHRGTRANQPGMMRKSLICHYSGINHRDDMPSRAEDQNGNRFVLFGNPLVE